LVPSANRKVKTFRVAPPYGLNRVFGNHSSHSVGPITMGIVVQPFILGFLLEICRD
jgi:hypothetical protein